ncbi:hypothetical protein IFM89_005726 [Coptis chinensis]|uniref:DUF4283 domain-containing protein n=1 Tax=Coptis chinensis TaxID=261450 RepID=A0A835IMX1_9MAGN|nr:hypothetical protein IFM89_005726 [Coptis chinensis]
MKSLFTQKKQVRLESLKTDDHGNVQLMVIGKWYGGNPINLDDLGTELHQIWQTRGQITMELITREHVKLIFEKHEGINHVLQNGPWIIHGHILSIMKWNNWKGTGEVSEEDTSCPLEFNQPMARVRVLLDIKERLTKDLTVMLETGTSCHIKFKYEKLELFCYFCGIIGHDHHACRLRAQHRYDLVKCGGSGKDVKPNFTSMMKANKFFHGIACTEKHIVTISGHPRHPRYNEIPTPELARFSGHGRSPGTRGRPEKDKTNMAPSLSRNIAVVTIATEIQSGGPSVSTTARSTEGHMEMGEKLGIPKPNGSQHREQLGLSPSTLDITFRWIGSQSCRVLALEEEVHVWPKPRKVRVEFNLGLIDFEMDRVSEPTSSVIRLGELESPDINHLAPTPNQIYRRVLETQTELRLSRADGRIQDLGNDSFDHTTQFQHTRLVRKDGKAYK